LSHSIINGCYRFESIEATSLALIPLVIRYRLDQCAIKLHLQQWQQFSQTERAHLLHMAFTSTDDTAAWAEQLTAFVQRRCNVAPDRLVEASLPDWQNLDRWPATILERCTQLRLPLPALSAWQHLTPQHRHALCKIARSRHEYLLLEAALQEFLPNGQ
jgi:hypothetical protein